MRQAYRLRVHAQTQLGGCRLADEKRALRLQVRDERVRDVGKIRARLMPQRGGHSHDVVQILGRENPTAQPSLRLRAAVQVEVGETMLFCGKRRHRLAQLFQGELHGSTV